MLRFQIVHNGIVIGLTDFEFGDPPMGVAFGRLFPTGDYHEIQPSITDPAKASLLELEAHTPDGSHIPCVGVAIEDFSSELGEQEIHVTALGIGYPLYAELFPEHVNLYERQFPSAP